MCRFLSAEKSGRVMCERTGEQGLGPEEQFAVEPAAGGGWALRSAAWGTYLGGHEDLLGCTARVPAPNSGGRLAADDWWWAPHCGAHTQLYLRHMSHAKYAVLRDNELRCTAWLPWGVHAVLSLEQTHGAPSATSARPHPAHAACVERRRCSRVSTLTCSLRRLRRTLICMPMHATQLTVVNAHIRAHHTQVIGHLRPDAGQRLLSAPPSTKCDVL